MFFCYTFTNFWFNTIIYLRIFFTEFLVLFISMFFAQVSHTTIIFTWIIIRTMSLLISITHVLFLILKRWRCFFRTNCFYIRYTILFCPFNCVFWFLNTLFSCDRSVISFLPFILERNTLFIWCYNWYTFSMYIHIRNTWIVFDNIYLW